MNLRALRSSICGCLLFGLACVAAADEETPPPIDPCIADAIECGKNTAEDVAPLRGELTQFLQTIVLTAAVPGYDPDATADLQSLAADNPVDGNLNFDDLARRATVRAAECAALGDDADAACKGVVTGTTASVYLRAKQFRRSMSLLDFAGFDSQSTDYVAGGAACQTVAVKVRDPIPKFLPCVDQFGQGSTGETPIDFSISTDCSDSYANVAQGHNKTFNIGAHRNNCARRVFRFDIADLRHVTQARLNSFLPTGFDEMIVHVNGHLVYMKTLVEYSVILERARTANGLVNTRCFFGGGGVNSCGDGAVRGRCLEYGSCSYGRDGENRVCARRQCDRTRPESTIIRNILPFLRNGRNEITVERLGGPRSFRIDGVITWDPAYYNWRQRAPNYPLCADLSSPGGCADTGKVLECLFEENERCAAPVREYRCDSEAPTQNIISCGPIDNSVCGDLDFDENGKPTTPCVPSIAAADNQGDFGAAISFLEIARQTGRYYDEDSGRWFGGAANFCRDKVAFGLSDCCNTQVSPGNSNNDLTYALIDNAAANAANFAGSTYVYDALAMSDSGIGDFLTQKLFPSHPGLAGGELFTPQVSFYGVQVSYFGGQFAVAFDPVSFAVAVAIHFITQMLACEQEEQILGLKRGRKLCHGVGEWCSSDTLFGCSEEKEGYCCYNSKLARIVSEQSRVQLARDWGPPWSPNCAGLTKADLESLDWERMDLSEFIADIVPQNIDADSQSARFVPVNEAQIRDSIDRQSNDPVEDTDECKDEHGAFIANTPC